VFDQFMTRMMPETPQLMTRHGQPLGSSCPHVDHAPKLALRIMARDVLTRRSTLMRKLLAPSHN